MHPSAFESESFDPIQDANRERAGREDDGHGCRQAIALARVGGVSALLVASHPALPGIRRYCAAQVAGLPDGVRRLREPASYPVSYSHRLVGLQRAVEAADQSPRQVGDRSRERSMTSGTFGNAAAFEK